MTYFVNVKVIGGSDGFVSVKSIGGGTDGFVSVSRTGMFVSMKLTGGIHRMARSLLVC